MATSDINARVDVVRGFNRFYTKQIGVLHEGLLGSPFSLTEVRVLYELANRERPTAADLIRELGLDAGYLSRILRGFAKRGLIIKTPSTADRRQTLLSLTARGRRAFAPLNARSHEEVAAMLTGLSAARQACLIEAMGTIQTVLGAHRDRKSETVAHLRLMYVEPDARGLGIGSRLAEECIRFGRQVGYRKIVLWTNSVLVAARHIYQKAGFRLVHSEPHHGFGHDLIGETGELPL